MIDEQRNLEIYGYESGDLSPDSHKPIVVRCDECGRVRISTRKAYRDLCLSCAGKKRYTNLEERKKTSEANKKYWDDPESHKKASESHKKYWDDPESHKKASEYNKKSYKENPERTLKQSEAHKKRYEDPNERKKTSESMKKHFSDADGDPIEMHHLIYDHNDKTRFTIPLRMSAHKKVHVVMRKQGIKTIHINVKEE